MIDFRKAPRQFAFLVLQVFFILLTAEATLYTASVLSPRVHEILAERPESQTARIEDRILGHRPSPDHPGHDSRGFRNPDAYAQVDIVALGDSQTYGSGVEADEAWPRQLGRAAKLSTYNYAFGGYGPTHSLAIMDEVLALSPKIVIEGFYSGNDLYDCFSMVYLRGQLPQLASTDAEVLAELTQIMESGSLKSEVEQLFRYSGRSTWREFLASYSKTWALARAVARFRRQNSEEVDWEYWRNRAQSSHGRLQAVESKGQRTILTPSYRYVALNLDDPRIAEGQRLALESLKQMSDVAPERFLVVLIPTKELVFASMVAELGGAATDYWALVDFERRHWEETRAFLEANAIDYVDTLPVLSAALERGVKVYRSTNDGHPSPAGYAAISERIQAKLEELDWLTDLPKGAGP